MLEPGSHRFSKPASILVATDFADIDRLFPIALEQARESGARLFILHVLTSTNSVIVDPGGLPYYNPTEAIDYAEKFLASYCAEAHQAGVQCEVLVREGAPSQQILSVVRQRQIDRVFLGTRGRGKWGKLLLGSVAEQVLRSVQVPVLTLGPEVHTADAPVDGPMTILHATSLSRASHASAALACEIARTSGALLLMLHVLAPDQKGIVSQEATDRANRALAALIPADLACQCSCMVRTAKGNAAIEILAEASRLKAGLIILGAVNSSPLNSLAREGTVYRVLAHAHCPVLTLREEHIAAENRSEKEGLALHEY
jgi:nucleotide-binding universal stress UspA family protein